VENGGHVSSVIVGALGYCKAKLFALKTVNCGTMHAPLTSGQEPTLW
jgi:hypothetical protein